MWFLRFNTTLSHKGICPENSVTWVLVSQVFVVDFLSMVIEYPNTFIEFMWTQKYSHYIYQTIYLITHRRDSKNLLKRVASPCPRKVLQNIPRWPCFKLYLCSRFRDIVSCILRISSSYLFDSEDNEWRWTLWSIFDERPFVWTEVVLPGRNLRPFFYMRLF